MMAEYETKKTKLQRVRRIKDAERFECMTCGGQFEKPVGCVFQFCPYCGLEIERDV